MPSMKVIALGLAMASLLQATPVVIRTSGSDLSEIGTPALPEKAVNLGIMTDQEIQIFLDKNQANTTLAELKARVAEASNALPDTSPAPAKTVSPASDVTIFGDACDQGACPDLNKEFDMLHTVFADVIGGTPVPIPVFWEWWNFRVNDCGQCKRSDDVKTDGGCWDFDTCGGRKQTICMDRGYRRSHRIWHGYEKKCYFLETKGYGDCGPIWSRGLLYPTGQTACNW